LTGAKIFDLRETNFHDFISQATTPILVDFWAEWCGPCRMIAPVVEEVAAEYEGRIQVGKINVDENRDIAASLGVVSIPTLIVFKNGREMERTIGYRTKEELRRLLEKYI
jgi:thioredoxin 1